VILLSTHYNQSKMIALYLATMIKQNKKHHIVLKNFILLVEFFFFKRILRFLGLQIRVTGKLGGKMRRSKFHYKLGKVCLQTLSIGLNFNIALSYTKFGIISIKV
jgi:ribosomal protein S3